MTKWDSAPARSGGRINDSLATQLRSYEIVSRLARHFERDASRLEAALRSVHVELQHGARVELVLAALRVL